MPQLRPTDDELRTQIEAVTGDATEPIEERIATALRAQSYFHDAISPKDLAVILRGVVYTMFARQRVAGMDVGLVHNVPNMQVRIRRKQAHVNFLVHIHKPITAFLKFEYILQNDPNSNGRKIRLKDRSLKVAEHTRRFDIKAKAALAAINVRMIAHGELADPGAIILKTLPPQLERHGVAGALTSIQLQLEDKAMRVMLRGNFWPITPEDKY
jgi:hypothetical protein